MKDILDSGGDSELEWISMGEVHGRVPKEAQVGTRVVSLLSPAEEFTLQVVERTMPLEFRSPTRGESVMTSGLSEYIGSKL